MKVLTLQHVLTTSLVRSPATAADSCRSGPGTATAGHTLGPGAWFRMASCHVPHEGFLKLGDPEIIHWNRIFHYKPILRIPPFYGNPQMCAAIEMKRLSIHQQTTVQHGQSLSGSSLQFEASSRQSRSWRPSAPAPCHGYPSSYPLAI